MRMLIDFFPIGLFVAVYKLHDIYTATAVLMAATVVQMLLIRRIEGKLSKMHQITLAALPLAWLLRDPRKQAAPGPHAAALD